MTWDAEDEFFGAWTGHAPEANSAPPPRPPGLQIGHWFTPRGPVAAPPPSATLVAALVRLGDDSGDMTVVDAIYHRSWASLRIFCVARIARAAAESEARALLGVYSLAERRMVGAYLISGGEVRRSWGFLL